jgi:hypothetical protein
VKCQSLLQHQTITVIPDMFWFRLDLKWFISIKLSCPYSESTRAQNLSLSIRGGYCYFTIDSAYVFDRTRFNIIVNQCTQLIECLHNLLLLCIIWLSAGTLICNARRRPLLRAFIYVACWHFKLIELFV